MSRQGRKAVYRGPWKRVRATVLERDGYVCQIGLLGCSGQATCVDHITPVSWGGAWYDPSNLRAACWSCNDALGRLARKHAPKPDPKPRTTPIPRDITPSRSW